jgi:tetratricopeptide (TPR) repeat protein
MLQNDLQAVLSEAQRGRFKPTLKLAKAGIKKHPNHPAFPNFAAIALCSMNRQKEAIPYFAKALKLDPAFLDARRNLGLALLVLGDFTKSEQVFSRLVEFAPEDATAWQHLATARLELNTPQAALIASDRAIELAPNNADFHALRSAIRQRQHQIVAALADCQNALDLAPDNPDLWIRLSTLHMIRSDNENAIQTAEKAVEIAPTYPPALRRFSEEQTAAGHIEQAITTLNSILKLEPATGFDIETLARLHSADQNAGLLATAKSTLTAARKGSEGSARAQFALATIARQVFDFDLEKLHLDQANRTMSRLAPYDTELETRRTNAIIKRFSSPSARSDKATAPQPIFVVGLPRSGTTLTEAMLGAHPRICPMGERYITRPLYDLIDADLLFDSETYIKYEATERSPMSPPQDLFTDKLPENYKMIGFLRQAYPGCRIIHVHRDPRDVALSMWRASFALGAVTYTYDQRAMADHFNLYRRLMSHWHGVYPGEILDVAYEDLTRDPIAISQTIAAHCGLDWTDAMAHPDQHADRVRTYTAHQLRQPVHQKSVGGWQRHAGMLEEFIEGLDPELWPEVQPRD